MKRSVGSLLGLAGFSIVGIGAWLWLQRPPKPPEIPLAGLEADVAQAVRSARDEVAKQPRSADTWGLLGQTLLGNQIADKQSLICFLEAERLDSSDPRWPYYQGIVLVNRGDREEALGKLTRAADLCDEQQGDAAPRLALAETLLALGRDAEAEEHVRQVWTRNPQDARAQYDLALVAAGRNDLQECRRHLEACLVSPQARHKASVQLAALCLRTGDKQGAVKFRKLAEQEAKDKDWPDPFVAEYLALSQRQRDRFRLVDQLEAAGRFAQAGRILADMVEKDPADFLPQLMLGRILPQIPPTDQVQAMRLLEAAEQHLRKAEQLAPEKAQTYYLLSLVLFRQGEMLLQKPDRPKAVHFFEQAVESARRALAITPDFGPAYMALGLSLKFLGRRAEGLSPGRSL
jgi:tetratricopeptide (TPR) repeat protein